MLRTNLSTRPFYNERAVHLAIALFALIVGVITVWNVVSVLGLSRQNTELATRVNRDHDEAAQLTQTAADIRGRINQADLQRVVDAAREANSLIDQRTFSWTAFFNHIEATMPPDVMLASVRPSVDDGVTRVLMQVLGRRVEDIDEFIEKLEATGAFDDVVPAQQDRTDEGLYRVAVESVYTGSSPADAATEAPAQATPEKPAKAAAAQPGGPR